jgi:hypothetical protein
MREYILCEPFSSYTHYNIDIEITVQYKNII